MTDAPDSPAGPPVLVVGSYPPIRSAGAPVALEQARRLWAEGAEVVVASPRASAAKLTVGVAGPLAGRRLANLRAVTGATRLILCVERDLPVPTAGYPTAALPLVQRVTLRYLTAALRGFDHVTLIVCGDHGLPPATWAELSAAADEVDPRPEAVGSPGVTALGPSETTPRILARKSANLAARVVFGRHAPRVRAAVAKPVWAFRRWRASVLDAVRRSGRAGS